MILRMTTFMFAHVVISLAGIFSGFLVAYGLLTATRRDGWTAFFLATTVATSVTGFLLPADRILPSHGVGIVSLLVLAAAIYAFYGGRLAGPWRGIYVVTAMTALYLNVFVMVAQLFSRVQLRRLLSADLRWTEITFSRPFFSY